MPHLPTETSLHSALHMMPPFAGAPPQFCSVPLRLAILHVVRSGSMPGWRPELCRPHLRRNLVNVDVVAK